jgi:uncharacterized protein
MRSVPETLTRRKYLTWVPIVQTSACLALTLLLAGPSTAASFDCHKASTATEKTICGNAVLSDLDSQLEAAFKAAFRRYASIGQKALLDSQRIWLKTREASCAASAGSQADCLKGLYTARLKVLQTLAKSPVTALLNLTWTDGLVCQGDKALLRFSHDDGMDNPFSNAPPEIGGALARAADAKPSCTLADGRVVRYKTASENDAAAYGECGGETSQIYSVWVGDKKVVNREIRAGHCDSDPVRALYLNGAHLTKCQEQRGPSDSAAASTDCSDISAQLAKGAPDPTDGKFLVTQSAPDQQAFCEGLIRDLPPKEQAGTEAHSGDADWPQKTAFPSQPLVGDGATSADFDLNNSGSAQHVFIVRQATHFFDGDLWLIAPKQLAADKVQDIVAGLGDDPPDLASLRKQGFQIFAGDQTPYGEPRYVHFTPFQKNGATFLFARWATNLLDQPTEMILRPMPGGTQKLVCTYQAIPNL